MAERDIEDDPHRRRHLVERRDKVDQFVGAAGFEHRGIDRRKARDHDIVAPVDHVGRASRDCDIGRLRVRNRAADFEVIGLVVALDDRRDRHHLDAVVAREVPLHWSQRLALALFAADLLVATCEAAERSRLRGGAGMQFEQIRRRVDPRKPVVLARLDRFVVGAQRLEILTIRTSRVQRVDVV